MNHVADQPADPRRRTFMGRAIVLMAGLVALGWAIPLMLYSVLPSLRRRSSAWVNVGEVRRLSVSQPQELEMVVTRSDGWRTITTVKSLWAYRTSATEVVAYASMCPHLGCAYAWNTASGRFICPCHDSVFALDGHVLAGPAPRPLDRLEAKVEKGHLFVLPQEFRAGVNQRIPV